MHIDSYCGAGTLIIDTDDEAVLEQAYNASIPILNLRYVYSLVEKRNRVRGGKQYNPVDVCMALLEIALGVYQDNS